MPASATPRLSTVIVIVSRERQEPFIIVQTKLKAPGVSPVTVVFGLFIAVIVALLLVVHVPTPALGVLAAIVAVELVSQIS